MAFFISPVVNVSEIDLTTGIPGVSTTGAGLAGAFKWGPVDEINLITSENTLIETFQKPASDATGTYFWLAANFLAYSSKLYVVRVVKSDALNAVSGTSPVGILVKNSDDYDAKVAAGNFSFASQGVFVAKYPGALGNSLKVSMSGSGGFTAASVTGCNITGGTAGVAVTITKATIGDTPYTNNVAIGSIVTFPSGETRKITGIASGALTAEAKATALVAGDLGTPKTVTIAWEYTSSYNNAPSTSTYATDHGGSNDEMHVVVVDKDGLWSGIAGTILEKYSYLSKATDAKNSDGSSNHFKNVINSQSKYVKFSAYPTNVGVGTVGNYNGTSTQTYVESAPCVSILSLGADGTALTNSELNAGYLKFQNGDSIDLSLVICPPLESTTIKADVANYIVNNVTESRKDCVAFLSPRKELVVGSSTPATIATQLAAWRDGTGGSPDDVALVNSSYAFCDSAWKQIYDRHNDIYRWTPLCADTAGLCARTDDLRDPWWSPAGFNRGVYKNVVRLSWAAPSLAERDVIYAKGINPCCSFAGQGHILYGDKTLLSKPSAFDRINVRRLFIVLEKAIATFAKFGLFEFNDFQVRRSIVNVIEPYLKDIQGRRGIYDFKVVCDESNNTGEVIDRNELRIDVYIKPSKSVNYIQLNMIAVRTGVQFSEVVGSF